MPVELFNRIVSASESVYMSTFSKLHFVSKVDETGYLNLLKELGLDDLSFKVASFVPGSTTLSQLSKKCYLKLSVTSRIVENIWDKLQNKTKEALQ